MTRVKICGLTREEDVDTVVDAGADAAGFISGFPESPRNLPMPRALSLISRVPLFVTSVLVTTGQSLVEHSEMIKRATPRAIQLYGSSFSPETVRSTFRSYLIRPYSVGREESDDVASIAAKAKEATRGYDALITDTYRKGYEGGTGLTSDWSACAAIRKAIAPTPMILSGGLRPENIEAAISTITPFCVDVSSGVESTPGVKDEAKVRSFVAKARAAEGRRVAP